VVRLRVWAEIRATWRSIVVMALLLGIGGGVALVAIAGARRTDAAMDQFVSYTLPDHGGVIAGGDPFSTPQLPGPVANSIAPLPQMAPVLHLPQVASYMRAPYLFFATSPSGAGVGSLNVFASADAQGYRNIDRPLVVAGSFPRADRPFDAAINELATQKLHLRVGSHLKLYAYAASQFLNGQPDRGTPGAPTGPSFTVRIAAIIRYPYDVNAIVPVAAQQDVTYEGQQDLFLTPAFLERLANGLGLPVQKFPGVNAYALRLRRGPADLGAVAASVSRVSGGQLSFQAGNLYAIPQAAATAQRGIHLEVVALYLFGALAALVTLLLVGQAIARQVTLQSEDYATLRSLGATRSQIVGIVSIRAAVIAAIGGVLAMAAAFLVSPLMPIGLARQAEIHPGFSFDTTVLALGFVAITTFFTARAAVPAWRMSKRAAPAIGGDGYAGNPSSLSDAMARWPLPPSIVTGVRLALEPGRGRSAVPTGTAIVSAVVAVAALTASLTFGGSLGHLVNTATEQGWNWDVLVGNPNDVTDRKAQYGAMLAHNPFVGSYSGVAILSAVTIGSSPQDRASPSVLVFDPLKGNVSPPLLQGRAPQKADEIVLGTKTLAALHKQVGDPVSVDSPLGTILMRVVGRMLVPSVGDLLPNGLGYGGWVSGAFLRHAQAAAASNPNVQPPPVNLFAVRYVPGASHAAAFASIRSQFGPIVLRQLPSEDALNLQSVDGLPLILAGLVALLGAATVGNALVTSVRRRRRDLATLKTLGFVQGQIAATVAWQATTFALFALVFGIPLGISAGRLTWNAVASNIGSISPGLVPELAVAAVVPATLVVANVIAALPGWSAARIPAAVALRAE
jgi:hypothetical protein